MEQDKTNFSSQETTPVENKVSASGGFEADILKDIPKTKGHNRVLFVILGLLGLIILFTIAGLFLVLSGGENNPLAIALGLDGTGAAALLYVVVGLIFGAVTIAGLLSSMFGIFKLTNTKKEDKETRKKSIGLAAASIVVTLIGIAGVLFSFSGINNAPGANNEIIQTSPAVTTGLTAPVSITFSAGNIPINRDKYNVIAYNWSFGDGERATGPNVTHTFNRKPANGLYTVTLKVNFQEIGNLLGEIQEEQFTRIIGIENEKVFATFNFTPEEGQAPLEVDFDASESKDPDGTIVKLEWDFNADGIYDSEGEKVSHTFEEVGSFPVKLRVTDNNGETNTEEHIVVVKSNEIIEPVVKNSPNDSILTPSRAYQFDASESKSKEGTIVKFEWNFGDGEIQSGRRVTHAYDKEGVYEITLKLTDDAGNTRSISKNYTISESSSGLFAKFSTLPAANAAQTVNGNVPLRINFDAGASSGANIVDFQWDFDNDGKLDATGQKVEHVFTKTGTYDATLTITSAENKTAKTSVKVVVGGSDFEARVTANPTNGIVPLTVNFDATSTKLPEGENIIAFRWNFGDGTPLLTEGPIVTHRFNSVDTFKVEVTAITANNKTSTASTNVTVKSTPLKSCYTMSRKVGPAPLTVTFNPQCSTGTISAYAWKFGVVSNSNERRPTHTFNEPGTYQVELEVSDSGNNINKFVDTVVVE